MRVAAHGLAHSFDGVTYLFQNLDFELHPGEVVGLVGPSGSGKSTLLGIIAGWTRPTKGSVACEEITSTAWVFQNPLGVRSRTVLDHVVLPLLGRGMSRIQAEPVAMQILQRFHLERQATKRFAQLSGGEAQRLMLSRATAKAPDLLLVDEPTAQLDRSLAAQVNTVLGQLASRDTIVVVATHDLDTKNACNRVLDLGDWVPTLTGESQ